MDRSVSPDEANGINTLSIQNIDYGKVNVEGLGEVGLDYTKLKELKCCLNLEQQEILWQVAENI